MKIYGFICLFHSPTRNCWNISPDVFPERIFEETKSFFSENHFYLIKCFHKTTPQVVKSMRLIQQVFLVLIHCFCSYLPWISAKYICTKYRHENKRSDDKTPNLFNLKRRHYEKKLFYNHSFSLIELKMLETFPWLIW